MDQNKLNKAIAFHRAQDFHSAKEIYEEVIRNDDKHHLPLFLLGTLEIDARRYSEAIKYLKLSLDKNPNHQDIYLNLGTAYYELKDYKNCKKYYEQGMKIGKINYNLLQNLARAYKDTGDFDKSINLYQKIHDHYPEDLKTIFFLYELRVFKLDKDLKKKIKLIIKNKNVSYTNQLYGNLLLSKFANRSSLHKDELKFLLKFHNVVYSQNKKIFEIRNRFLFDELINITQHYDSSSIIHANEKLRQSIHPIFIISHPRSGSTLIEKLIVYNQKNLMPGEETHIFSVIGEEFSKDNNFNLRLDEISSRIIDDYQNFGLISKKEKANFTDKSTDNVYFVGWIKSIFPNAKFINCIRDPKASIVSILRNNFGTESWAHRIQDIIRYIDNYYFLIDYWQKKHQIEIYNLKYEDLIDNFEDESKKLLDYCSLKWSKDIIKFNTSTDFISKTASNLQVRMPLYKSIDKSYESLASLFENDLKKYKWSHYSF
tara:strand:+ start:577 stop:2031 length:1455 start_codon:yes stop_codon:yes gene_type:complete